MIAVGIADLFLRLGSLERDTTWSHLIDWPGSVIDYVTHSAIAHLSFCLVRKVGF
jgi:hypothetical protein